MMPNVKPKTVFALAKQKRLDKKQSNTSRNKKNLNIQIEQLKKQINKLLLEKKLDKKQIEELKKELKDLQKRYNELDDESISSGPFGKY